MNRARVRLEVGGVVQGVGFRPFVYATASELALSGSVGNDSNGVIIEVEGEPSALDEFGRRLRADPPPLALIESIRATAVPPRGGTGFRIAATSRTEQGRTFASPDVATCADCLRELRDPADRRYRHPFITCTNCGPRFTIIDELPYDRCATTMASFPMCPDCAREYADPADRRFHAQPIACPNCGPTLEFVGPAGEQETGEPALARARRLLADGAVLAVKGLGGYHLACDAANETAVRTLRTRKRRGDKPFAVMVPDLEFARNLVWVDAVEEALLDGGRRPIVLLAKRTDPGRLVLGPSVAPGNPDLGLMLPYTPVHELLLGLDGGLGDSGDPVGPRALVMTSGNLGGEPIVHDDEQALLRLAPLADGWLRHDRTIRVPCDDSVVRVVDGEEVPIRRSRGYAPLPVALPFEVPATLAVGADVKNTCCLAEGRYAWLSQHVGDMDDLATLQAFAATERHLEELTGVRPTTLVADAHPAYRSAGWARSNAGARELRTVYHHHAHVAAVMGEHGLDGSTPVIGIAFDGTGYGTDGTIWGGEVLIADYKGFRRFAQLATVPLPGGDASVHRPYRIALSHLRSAGVRWDPDLPSVRACPPQELSVLGHQLDTGFGCIPTSSMGRLFDAVASLAGLRHVVDYEAQAAIELEGLSRGIECVDGRYRFEVRDSATGSETAAVADAAPVIRAVVADGRAGVQQAVIGARFHAGVAELVAELAIRARESEALEVVALTGGVFQNALLLSSSRKLLHQAGFTVLCHRKLPPNDGGLALGQILCGSSG